VWNDSQLFVVLLDIVENTEQSLGENVESDAMYIFKIMQKIKTQYRKGEYYTKRPNHEVQKKSNE